MHKNIHYNEKNTTKRRWCVICGAPFGKCDHGAPYTDDINKAYKIWMDYKNKDKDI